MTTINCHIPIKLRLVGEPSAAQLAQLGQTLVQVLQQRIALAERTIAARYNLASLSNSAELREPYQPAREDANASQYQLPSYDQHGQPVGMALHSRRRPWIIRKAINFHARIGQFLDFVETLTVKQSLESKPLYIDRFDELRWVSLWLVQVNQEYALSELDEQLSARAEQLSRRGANELLFYAMGTTEQTRRKLIRLDTDGLVADSIPTMQAHNQGHTARVNDQVVVSAGGWVLFASMILPKIDANDVLIYDPQLAITVPLHQLDFIVKGESFERLFNMPWGRYRDQAGDQLATLYLLPFTTNRRVHFQTLKLLVEAAVAASVDTDSAYFGNLYLLNQACLDWLPPAARQPASALTNPATQVLSEDQREGMWQADWHGAFVFAVLNPHAQQANLDDPQAEARLATPPSETPAQLISRFTSWANLDEDGLGAYLVGLIRRSTAQSQYVQQVLDELNTTNRDDVALAFTQQASEADLDSLAHSPSGRVLLVRLFDELTSGNLSDDEQQHAQRLLAARVRARSIELVEKRLANKRGLIFPFRKSGPTVWDAAPIMAEMLGDGRIRVSMPQHVSGISMFRAETRTLPSAVFSGGLVLDADEWISVKLYDEGGTVVQQPALYLLELANIATTSTLMKIATTSATVLSFGGGAAIAGTSRLVVFLDRAALAIGILGTVVDDHRGWIIATFGDAGRTFIKAVGVAEALAGVYGLGRLAFALPHVISDLRASWRAWRSTAAFQELSGAELRQAEQISQQAEQFLDNIDNSLTEMHANTPSGSTASAAADSPVAAGANDASALPAHPQLDDLAVMRQRKLAQAPAQRVMRRGKRAVGAENEPVAVYSDDEIRESLAEHTEQSGANDPFNPGDIPDENIRTTRTIRPGEYDGQVGDSSLLGQRLTQAGMPKPGPNYEAHHIIPANEPRADALREFAASKGLGDINDVDNGVWLPRGGNAENVGGEFKHEFTFDNAHLNDEYFTRLEDIFMRDPDITLPGIKVKLRQMRWFLGHGQLPPPNI